MLQNVSASSAVDWGSSASKEKGLTRLSLVVWREGNREWLGEAGRLAQMDAGW